MSTIAEIKLWGRTIGAVMMEPGRTHADFQYDPQFIESGIQPSPITMPLSRKIFSFPELSLNTFHGLPGLLADSLPDKFGNTLINEWLHRQGRTGESFNAVERLCYTGTRGMGALEFFPLQEPDPPHAQEVEIDPLIKLTSQILGRRTTPQTQPHAHGDEKALKEILRIGTSAGGARAKAVVAWNETTGEIHSESTDTKDDFRHWLIKFDGVHGNRDKEVDDPNGYGIIEYAYHKMARAAGIRMSDCRILEENGRSHFMTRRFDRTEDGKKLHMQSLGALAHYDFDHPSVNSYEKAFAVMRSLKLSSQDVEEQFRRMAFNIVARNQDDHVKNIAFLMDKSGEWSLAPAYDITYSYNPHGMWTAHHQMSMNGKRDDFHLEDFRECGKTALLKRGRAESILKQVTDAVISWPDHAEKAGVSGEIAEQIQSTFRTNIV